VTILDEVTGLLSTLNRRRGAFARTPSMTGYLNTRFLNPVKAPGVVLARARIVKIEERKVFIDGTIEDADGSVLAKADALFITLKTRL
jgi:acyl-coenzyme A thioesterase PaaI-like protein